MILQENKLKRSLNFIAIALFCIQLLPGCYTFRDISIPPNVKTVRVQYIENKAPYVNPLLSPRLTDKLKQKINNQTRLSQVSSDDAHYEISGVVTDYRLTTTGISNQQSSINRLNVTVHIVFKNRLDEKANFEADISRNFDFDANLSLQQAEALKGDEIIRNMTDEIFNRIFSNW
ncbi:MAG TPA: LptE family protein [Flavitalea sp.]|nr:LptE family protein [Flavitalea sp.]